MKYVIPALIALLVFLQFPDGQLSTAQEATDAQEPFVTGDGASFETAFHFPSVSDRVEVVGLEYWVLKELGLSSHGQMLINKDGISYDVHETDGGEVYFRLPPRE